MVILLAIVMAANLGATTADNATEWRSYEVYDPQVERHFVLNHEESFLDYNHCSTIAWFEDRWFCLWNANRVPKEAEPNQLIYMATSPDGKAWSEPELAFAPGGRSQNPIPCDLVQWQPALIVIDDELWCFWSQLSLSDGVPNEYYGCYFSRLEDPAGQWQNRKLEFDNGADVLFDGKSFRVQPMQNAVRLSTRRVIVPIILNGFRGPKAADFPDNESLERTTWTSEKRCGALYSDDKGKTWRVSPGTIQPGASWAQWEPTIWERPDGSLGMVARNNEGRKPPQGGPEWWECLIWSDSLDGGETWAPCEIVPFETVVSRMHVIRQDFQSLGRPDPNSRYFMVHNDARMDDPLPLRDRSTIALYFNRGGRLRVYPGRGPDR